MQEVGVSGGLVSVVSVAGSCSRGMVLSGLGLCVHRGRFLALLNPDKYKGAALLHVLNNFRAPSSNGVVFSKEGVGDLPPGHHRLGAMFRGCTLFSRVSVTRGVTFKLGVGNGSGNCVHSGVRCTLGLIGLRKCKSHSPSSLDNNRRRQVTVTHTVMGRPGILLLSRPLNTLSLGLHRSVRCRLVQLGGRLKVAFICMARSRRRTLAVSSAVIIVGRKCVRRVNAPRSVCGRPRGTFMTSFVKSDGVVTTAVLRSGIIHVLNTI